MTGKESRPEHDAPASATAERAPIDRTRAQAIDEAGRLLGVREPTAASFIHFRNGARTRAVLATAPGIAHRFVDRAPQVVAKLYKGAGTTPGSIEYQAYHRDWFHAVDALMFNAHVQKSLEGGLRPGVGPYAVLEFVPGTELSDILAAGQLDRAAARRIVTDVLQEIWIPLWQGGLRFKDCHPGNFVYRPDGATVMIDTEQMRKDADELLHRPGSWSQRDKHQAQGVARLPKLLQRIVSATGPGQGDSAVLRSARSALDDSSLVPALSGLGRTPGAIGVAMAAVDGLLQRLTRQGFL
jgi:hypothetical protein